MSKFVCKRLRLCNYLMERGFTPCKVEPDKKNPQYSIYLCEETPALTAAVIHYFSSDCYTARKKREERKEPHEYDKEKENK